MSEFGVSSAEVMKRLKEFQRKTARYAFDRMYGNDPTPRFLVADEVGLGKTLVARGVIAQMIEHHEKIGDGRIDIVYICSNAAIAAQNLHKLNVVDAGAVSHADRLTMLTTEIKNLRSRKVNMIAITPGTSFNPSSGAGKFEERALIFALLEKIWGKDALKGKPAARVFYRGIADNKDAQWRLRNAAAAHHFPGFVVKAAREAISERDAERIELGKPRLRILFRRTAEAFRRKPFADSALADRAELISELRRLLAQVALDALEPDLVILDEFQRFSHLIESESDEWATRLAQQLFNHREKITNRQTRTLLLSATPYKSFTASTDADGEDHYGAFTKTIGFLLDDERATAKLQEDLRSLHRSMLTIEPGNLGEAEEICNRISARLKPVMARTERLASTPDRNGMLEPVTKVVELEAPDVSDYVVASKVSELLGQYDMTEFWKSSPYLLSFMENYTFKYQLKAAISEKRLPEELAKILRSGAGQLDWKELNRYAEVDPANAKLRALMEDTIGRDVWQLLWLPPALPYYDADGVFESELARSFTKRLIFSAWNVVPKAISSLVSYEVERRAFESAGDEKTRTYRDYAKRSGSLLAFNVDRDGRAASMSSFTSLIPSPSLASIVDPLQIAAKLRTDGIDATLEAVRAEARKQLESRLRSVLGSALDSASIAGADDQDWYWAAALLLDLELFPETTKTWWSRDAYVEAWTGAIQTNGSDDEATAGDQHFALHVDRARALIDDPESVVASLGRVPDDLLDVLVERSLGGPAVCALRSIGRVTTGDVDPIHTRNGAARIAWGFRSLFNGTLETAIVAQSTAHKDYWRAALEYGAIGNLQAMLDEYAHTLSAWLGVAGKTDEEVAGGIASAAAEALSMRTVGYSADVVSDGIDGLSLDSSRQIRSKFAISFGQQKAADEKVINRIQTVRNAFNSPFWPFVLTTTSIGQEGLDFHLYSHAVVHWNLPGNPVDFEQREGRVHRFKGHAVRKNVAHACGDAAFRCRSGDPWEAMFADAVKLSKDPDELKPYWVFDPEGSPARIERYVTHLPLSKDAKRLTDLLRAVGAYRLSFGQPRQEELVELLTGRMSDEELEEISGRLRIDLGPS